MSGAPSQTPPAHDVNLMRVRLPGATEFVHRLASTPVGARKRSACGDEPAGGFRMVSEAEYRRRACPDCWRREHPVISGPETESAP